MWALWLRIVNTSVHVGQWSYAILRIQGVNSNHFARKVDFAYSQRILFTGSNVENEKAIGFKYSK